MSASIDNKIVSMEFDNSKFEGNVAVTLSTLDKLQDSLRFEGATKGLEEIDKASKKVSFGGLGDAVENVGQKFSAMEVAAITAISNITTKVMNLGEQLVKSLTIDQVSGGFSKYEEQLKNVRTISNATERSVEEVEAQLEKLLWYTDETSYQYTAMVNNVAKFTAQNIQLEDAVKQMQGIANMAGLAGASVTDATHAMDGFSKAMAQGYMSRQNWRWVQTAHLETVATKKEFIEAAKACGVLSGEIEGVGVTTDGTTISVENFIETLKEKWLTKEVMAKAFENVSVYSDALYTLLQGLEDITGETMTAYEAMGLIDDAANISDDTIKAYARGLELATGEAVSFEEAQKKLLNSLDETAKKAFKAGQEYRTFTDAIYYIKDAATSAWMQVYNNIFGNINEASALWGEIGDQMYTTFVEPIYTIADAAEEFKNFGGLDKIIDAFKSLVSVADSVIDPLKEAYGIIFPSDEDMTLGKKFYNWVYKLNLLFGDLAFKGKELDGLRVIFEAILKPVKLIVGLIGKLRIVALALILIIRKLVGVVLEAVADIKNLGNILDNVFGSERAEKIRAAWSKIATNIGNAVDSIKKKISEGLINTLDKISNSKVLSGIANAFLFVKEAALDLVTNGLDYIANHSFIETLTKFKETIVGVGIAIKDKVLEVFPAIGEWFTKIGNKLAPVVNLAKGFGNTIKGILSGFNIKINTTSVFATIASSIGAGVQIIVGAFMTLKNKLSELGDSAFGEAIAKIWSVLKFNFGKFGNLMSTTWEGIKHVFSLIVNGLKEFKMNLSKMDFAGFGKLFDDFGNSMKSTVEKFKGIGASIDNSTGGIFGKIGAFFSNAWATIKRVSKNIEWSQVAIIALLASLTRLTSKVTNLVNTWKRVANSYVDKKRSQTVASIMLSISVAIAALTASLMLLSNNVDPENLTNTAKALALIIGVMAASTVAIGAIFKIAKINEDLKSFGIALAGFGAAVLMMTTSMNIVKDIKWRQIWKGFVAMNVCIGVMLGGMVLLQKVSKVGIGSALSLLLVSYAIQNAMNTLSSEKSIKAYNTIIDKFMEIVLKLKEFFFENNESVMSKVGKAIVAAAATFGLIGLFKTVNFAGVFNSVGKALTGVALFIGAMALILKLVSGMSDGEIKRGITVVGLLSAFAAGILAMFGLGGKMIGSSSKQFGLGGNSEGSLSAALNASSTGVNIKQFGSALLSASFAIGVMAIILKTTSKMSDTEILQGIKVVGALGLFASGLIASTSLAKNVKPGTMLTLAFILLEVFAAFNKFTDPEYSLNIKDIWQQFLAFGVMIGIIDTILMSASKLSNKSFKPLLAIFVLLAAVFGGIYLLTKTEDPDKVTKSCIALAGTMAGLGMFVYSYGTMARNLSKSKNLTKGTVAKSVLAIVAAVGTMVGGIIALTRVANLNAIKDTWYQLGFVMTAMGGFMVMAGEAMSLMKGSSQKGKEFADMGALAALMFSVVASVAALDWAMDGGNLANSWAQLSVVIGALGAFLIEASVAMGLMKKSSAGKGSKEWRDLVVLVGLLGACIASMVTLTTLGDLSKLETCWYQISAIMVAFGVFVNESAIAMRLMPKAKDIWGKGLLASMLSIAAFALEFVGIIALLNLFNLDGLAKNAEKLSLLMDAYGLFLILAMAALAIITPSFGAIEKGFVGMLEALAWIVLVFIAIGALAAAADAASKAGVDFEAGLDVVKMVFLKVGEAVDEFTKNTLVNATDIIVTTLEMLVGGIVDCFNKFGSIDLNSAQAAYEVVKVFSAMIGLEGLSGIVKLINPFTSVVGHFGDFITLGVMIKKFSETVSGINASATFAATRVIDSFTKLYSAVGVFSGLGFGITKMAGFAASMPLIATGIGKFVENAPKIQPGELDPVIEAFSSIVKIAHDIPNDGGMVSLFTGGNNMGLFAIYLKGMGEALNTFAEKTKDFTYGDNQKQAIELFKDITAASKDIPNSGGLWGMIVGNNDLGAFGVQLGLLGWGIGKFASGLTSGGWSGYNDNIKGAVDVATDIAEMTNKINKRGGLAQLFIGSSSATVFAAELPGLALGIVGFAGIINSLPDGFASTNNMNGAIAAALGLAEVSKTIEDTNMLAVWTQNTDFDGFTETVPKFATALSKFATTVGSKDFRHSIAAVELAQNMATIGEILAVPGLTDGYYSLNDFVGTTIPELAEAIAALKAAITDYDPDTAIKAVTSLQTVADTVNAITQKDYDEEVAADFKKSLKSLLKTNFKFDTADVNEAAEQLKESVISMLNVAGNGVAVYAANNNTWHTIGSFIRTSIINGLEGKDFSETRKAGQQTAKSIEIGFREVSKVNSPSPLYKEIGSYITKSVAMGMEMDHETKVKLYSAINSMGGEIEAAWLVETGVLSTEITRDVSEAEANAIVNGVLDGANEASKVSLENYPEIQKFMATERDLVKYTIVGGVEAGVKEAEVESKSILGNFWNRFINMDIGGVALGKKVKDAFSPGGNWLEGVKAIGEAGSKAIGLDKYLNPFGDMDNVLDEMENSIKGITETMEDGLDGLDGGGAGGKVAKTLAQIRSEYAITENYITSFYERHKEQLDYIAGKQGNTGYALASDRVYAYAQRLYEAKEGTTKLTDIAANDMDKLEEYWKGVGAIMDEVAKKYKDYAKVDIWGSKEDAEELGPGNTADYLSMNNKTKMETYKKWEKDVRDVFEKLKQSGATEYAQEIFDKIVGGGVDDQAWLTIFKNSTVEGIKAFNESSAALTKEADSFGNEMFAMAADLGYELNEGVMDGVLTSLYKAQDSGTKSMEAAKQAMEKYRAEHPFDEEGLATIQGLINGMQENLTQVNVKIHEIYNSADKTAGGLFDTSMLYVDGQNVVQGLINGINSKVSALKTAMEKLASVAETTITGPGGFNEHSPSKDFFKFGVYVVQGLVNGIRSQETVLENTMESLAETTESPVYKTFSDIVAGMANEHANPVITPVLDLSLVRQGLSEIDGMIADRKTAEIAAKAGLNGGLGKVVNQTFNQYNTSPKSLDRLTIYRQSKNQMTVMKEAISQA